MTNIADRRPFSMPVVKHGTLTAASQGLASGTMITRSPWPAPTSKYYVLRKVIATQVGATSGQVLNIWDQDTSNATPVSRGSAGGPLIQIPITPLLPISGIAGTTMTVLDIDACPMEFFQAGVTMSQSLSGIVTVSVELDVV